MYCPRCGRENEPGALYCAGCGERLPEGEPARESEASVTSTERTVESETIETDRLDDGEFDTVAFKKVTTEKKTTREQPAAAQPTTPPPTGSVYPPYGGQPPVGGYPPQPGPDQSGGAPYGYASYNPYGQGAPVPPPPRNVPPTPPVQRSEGCFGAAWNDLTGSDGWFRRTILLGLLNAVPILNFCVDGYAMDWGREVAFERREAMPTHLFGHKTMLLGLCISVFELLMGIFMLVCSAVASTLVPILGAIAAIVFCVFTSMFASTGLIRMGIFGKFGAAFDLVEDWRAFAKNLGTLFCASFLPGIVIGVIAGLIVFILFSILFAASGMSIYALTGSFNPSGYYGGYGMYDPSAFVGLYSGVGIGFVCVTLVSWFILAVAGALIKLVTYRALGHWAARTVPEWRAEAFEAQKIYGVDFPAAPMLEELRRRL